MFTSLTGLSTLFLPELLTSKYVIMFVDFSRLPRSVLQSEGAVHKCHTLDILVSLVPGLSCASLLLYSTCSRCKYMQYM